MKAIFVPTEQTTLTNDLCAPLVATLPLEVISLDLKKVIYRLKVRHAFLVNACLAKQ